MDPNAMATVARAAGGLSAAAGVAAIALDEPFLGAVAGVLGLTAGFLSFELHRAGDAAGAGAASRIVELEAQVTEAADALSSAQEALSANLTEMAATRAAAGTTGVASTTGGDPLIDADTGLFGDAYFGVTLAARVAAARRHLRPVAVVFIDVVQGVRDGEPSPAPAGIVAEHVRSTLREADTACRLTDGRLALVLEDTPENGAVWTVERIRRSLGATDNGFTLWAGIACYPAHAFDATELRARAAAALDAAGQWRQDRIEVATSSE